MKTETKTPKETKPEAAVAKPKKAPKKKALVVEGSDSAQVEMPVEKPKDTTKMKCFSKDDLLRFKLAEAKYQNAVMSVQIKTHEFEKAKAAWEAHGKELISEIERGKATFEHFMAELTTLREELGKKYEINFDRISYHESTGVIFEHHDTGPSVNKE